MKFNFVKRIKAIVSAVFGKYDDEDTQMFSRIQGLEKMVQFLTVRVNKQTEIIKLNCDTMDHHSLIMEELLNFLGEAAMGQYQQQQQQISSSDKESSDSLLDDVELISTSSNRKGYLN